MTSETIVCSHIRKKAKPSWQSGPFADQIAARIEAKRSGTIAGARREIAPAAIPAPLPSIEEVLGNGLAVIVRAEALRELLGWKASGEVREIA